MTEPGDVTHDVTRSSAVRDAGAFDALTGYLDGSGALAFLIALDGSYTWISREWERELGGDRDEIAREPRSLLSNVHPEDREPVLALVHRIERMASAVDATSWPQQHADVRVFDIAGRVRWLEVSCNVIVTGLSGGVVIGTARDVTPQHEANEGLAAQEQADAEASRATAEFVSKMSHELRTPLHAILGYAQLLEMGVGDPAEHLSRLRRAGDHVVQLLGDLLDYSRMSAGHLAVSQADIELGPVIDGAVDIVSALARTHEVTIDRVGDETQRVRADATRLRQVLVNVLTNAIKYNRPGGSVLLNATEGGGRVFLDVTDTGPGIASELLERVFVPFDRLGAESSAVAGAGLGLPLSLGLMRAMSGDIEIDSTDAGTSVRLVVRSSTADFAVPPRDVVCIDDDPESRRILEAVLTLLPGAVVHAAGTVSEGLRLLSLVSPSLIVLDRHLPGLDPDGVLQAVARLSPGCPVVLVSSDPAVLEPGFVRPPLVATFEKPLDLEWFLAAITRLWSLQPA